MMGLRPQLLLPILGILLILSPESCDEVKERLRAMALDDDEEEEGDDDDGGTFITPIAAIEAMVF